MLRASDLDWTWLANLPLGPKHAVRAKAVPADELFSLDRRDGRGRSGDRLVPDGGGGSGAAGRVGGGTAEPLRIVRAPPGPTRPGAGDQLAGVARQVPTVSSTHRDR